MAATSRWADIAISAMHSAPTHYHCQETDAGSFSIVTGAGGKELHFNGGANFEAKTSYDVTVDVNDTTASNHARPTRRRISISRSPTATMHRR